MTISSADYPDLRDVSIAEAARLLRMDRTRLRAIWESIPTAYFTAGGQGRVSIAGIKQWQHSRTSAGK